MNDIKIKTEQEIEIMRQSGKIAASVLDFLENEIKPGVKTIDLDQKAEKIILEQGGEPSFKNYQGYPNATCISINSCVVHGIPNEYMLKEGDVVGVDVGVFFNGFHSDTARTFACKNISKEAQKLIQISKLSLDLAIANLRSGIHLGDIQSLIQNTIESAGFSVIRDLSGHGIGRDLQEAPSILNFGKKGEGPLLTEGMVLAIEPMVATGDYKVKVLPDGWSVVTVDGSLTSHFEHTIALTSKGAEILTQ